MWMRVQQGQARQSVRQAQGQAGAADDEAEEAHEAMMSGSRCGRIALAAFLGASLVAIAASACPDDATRDIVVLGLAAGADIASTHYALANCSGCYEANPVMSEPSVSLVVKAGSIAATAWACDRLRKAGHPRGAKWLRWGVAGMWLGAAGWNLHKARALR